MTPDERADEIVWGWDLPDALCEVIASAIRSAENEALERAARHFDKGPKAGGFPSVRRANKTASIIRSFKHPSAKEDAR